MKNRYLIALFIVGWLLKTVGVMFKIMHWPYATPLLWASALLESVALIALVAKLLTSKDGQKFLDQ